MTPLSSFLAVEDNPRNQRLIKMILGHHYRLTFAGDGELALQLPSNMRPALILVDIQIPKINGLEVARQLKSHPATREIPIVAVTPHAMEGDRERIFASGCNGYIQKPIDTRSFKLHQEKFLA